MQIRVLDVDPLETYAREVHLEKWIDGTVVADENCVLMGNLYLKQELMLMLPVAGFKEVFVSRLHRRRSDFTTRRALFTAIR